MTTQNINTEKKFYSAPQIEKVVLDNEISLQLESAPTPNQGDEVMNRRPEYMKSDPFNSHIC